VLSEDQKKRVIAETQTFLQMASEFMRKESELHSCEKNIKINSEKLSRVAEEERQMDAAMEVLYGEVKKEAATRKIKEEIETLQKEWETLSVELDQLRTHLLKQMRNLPIPVNLEEPKKEESNMIFSFFDEAKFGEEGIKAMCTLLRQEPPLSFSDMVLLPDKIIVSKVSEKQEALRKIIDGIKSFRMRVDDLLKSYEQIDTMVERVRRSELYSGVLKVLSKKGKLSSDAIARFLNMDTRKVYDTCYNLTRSNWSPNPIKSSPSGEWELTLPGEILVNRLIQKSGEYDFGEKV
jgi:DNA repair exonuclease SbcCD ATPase subunit